MKEKTCLFEKLLEAVGLGPLRLTAESDRICGLLWQLVSVHPAVVSGTV